MSSAAIVETLAKEFSVDRRTRPARVTICIVSGVPGADDQPVSAVTRRRRGHRRNPAALRPAGAHQLEELERRRGTTPDPLDRGAERRAGPRRARESPPKRRRPRRSSRISDLPWTASSWRIFFLPHRRPEPEVQIAIDRGLEGARRSARCSRPEEEKAAGRPRGEVRGRDDGRRSRRAGGGGRVRRDDRTTSRTRRAPTLPPRRRRPRRPIRLRHSKTRTASTRRRERPMPRRPPKPTRPTWPRRKRPPSLPRRLGAASRRRDAAEQEKPAKSKGKKKGEARSLQGEARAPTYTPRTDRPLAAARATLRPLRQPRPRHPHRGRRPSKGRCASSPTGSAASPELRGQPASHPAQARPHQSAARSSTRSRLGRHRSAA